MIPSKTIIKDYLWLFIYDNNINGYSLHDHSSDELSILP